MTTANNWNVQTGNDMDIFKCFIMRILKDDPKMGMEWVKTYVDENGHKWHEIGI